MKRSRTLKVFSWYYRDVKIIIDKYNESLLVKNNNDMLELKIIVFKVISRVKRLQ